MIDAIKLMQEYHLVRAGVPLIPRLIYQLMRGDLDELWKTYRRRGDLASR